MCVCVYKPVCTVPLYLRIDAHTYICSRRCSQLHFFIFLDTTKCWSIFITVSSFSNSCLRLVSKRNAFLFSLPGIFIPELEGSYTEVEAPSKRPPSGTLRNVNTSDFSVPRQYCLEHRHLRVEHPMRYACHARLLSLRVSIVGGDRLEMRNMRFSVNVGEVRG